MAQRRINLSPVSAAGNPEYLSIDFPRVASQINHTLLRQGGMYRCRIQLDQDMPAGTYQVFALRGTWMLEAAFRFAHEKWYENHAEEMTRLSKGQNARWRDFRISNGLSGTTHTYLNANVTGLDGANLVTTQLTQGEFVLSSVTAENGTEYTFRVHDTTGTSGNSYNILQEYSERGNTQLSPDSADASHAYAEVDNDSKDANIANLQNDGNAPPYDKDNMEAGYPWMKVAELNVGGQREADYITPFFDVPLGMIVLKVPSTIATGSTGIYVEGAKGKYKGFSFESYGVPVQVGAKEWKIKKSR